MLSRVMKKFTILKWRNKQIFGNNKFIKYEKSVDFTRNL